MRGTRFRVPRDVAPGRLDGAAGRKTGASRESWCYSVNCCRLVWRSDLDASLVMAVPGLDPGAASRILPQRAAFVPSPRIGERPVRGEGFALPGHHAFRAAPGSPPRLRTHPINSYRYKSPNCLNCLAKNGNIGYLFLLSGICVPLGSRRAGRRVRGCLKTCLTTTLARADGPEEISLLLSPVTH
jgi:hypothetical protein